MTARLVSGKFKLSIFGQELADAAIGNIGQADTQ
jgi:hypothetical protein